jgi:hypothetical protein
MKLRTFPADFTQFLVGAASGREQKGSKKGAEFRAIPWKHGQFRYSARNFGES